MPCTEEVQKPFFTEGKKPIYTRAQRCNKHSYSILMAGKGVPSRCNSRIFACSCHRTELVEALTIEPIQCSDKECTFTVSLSE